MVGDDDPAAHPRVQIARDPDDLGVRVRDRDRAPLRLRTVEGRVRARHGVQVVQQAVAVQEVDLSAGRNDHHPGREHALFLVHRGRRRHRLAAGRRGRLVEPHDSAPDPALRREHEVLGILFLAAYVLVDRHRELLELRRRPLEDDGALDGPRGRRARRHGPGDERDGAQAQQHRSPQHRSARCRPSRGWGPGRGAPPNQAIHSRTLSSVRQVATCSFSSLTGLIRRGIRRGNRGGTASMVSRRVVRSYQARYSMGANKASMYDLTDAIDVHAHARGQDEEEPMHAAQEATRAGMKAVLFKSISPGRPWEVARRLQDDLDRWTEQEHLRSVKCLSAWIVGIPLKPIDFAEIKAAVEGGIHGMWMPPVTSAWSIYRLGGRGVWFDKARRYDDPVPPTAWEDALKTGIYVLDDHGRLLPAIRDTVRLCADHGVALSFGHLSPREMDALAEEIGAIGYRRAFIDHPFSEVFEFDVPKMKRWAEAGVRFALTWDELSPLLGVDPQDMVAAIRAVGPEHFMLSSDAGIPLLPQTVEAYRLLAAMLRAYGMTEVEMRQLMTGSAKEMLALS